LQRPAVEQQMTLIQRNDSEGAVTTAIGYAGSALFAIGVAVPLFELAIVSVTLFEYSRNRAFIALLLAFGSAALVASKRATGLWLLGIASITLVCETLLGVRAYLTEYRAYASRPMNIPAAQDIGKVVAEMAHISWGLPIMLVGAILITLCAGLTSRRSN